MMRVEKIVKEDDIQHELDTYNELLHPKGTIGCTGKGAESRSGSTRRLILPFVPFFGVMPAILPSGWRARS